MRITRNIHYKGFTYTVYIRPQRNNTTRYEVIKYKTGYRNLWERSTVEEYEQILKEQRENPERKIQDDMKTINCIKIYYKYENETLEWQTARTKPEGNWVKIPPAEAYILKQLMARKFELIPMKDLIVGWQQEKGVAISSVDLKTRTGKYLYNSFRVHLTHLRTILQANELKVQTISGSITLVFPSTKVYEQKNFPTPGLYIGLQK